MSIYVRTGRSIYVRTGEEYLSKDRGGVFKLGLVKSIKVRTGEEHLSKDRGRVFIQSTCN